MHLNVNIHIKLVHTITTGKCAGHASETAHLTSIDFLVNPWINKTDLKTNIWVTLTVDLQHDRFAVPITNYAGRHTRIHSGLVCGHGSQVQMAALFTGQWLVDFPSLNIRKWASHFVFLYGIFYMYYEHNKQAGCAVSMYHKWILKLNLTVVTRDGMINLNRNWELKKMSVFF